MDRLVSVPHSCSFPVREFPAQCHVAAQCHTVPRHSQRALAVHHHEVGNSYWAACGRVPHTMTLRPSLSTYYSYVQAKTKRPINQIHNGNVAAARCKRETSGGPRLRAAAVGNWCGLAKRGPDKCIGAVQFVLAVSCANVLCALQLSCCGHDVLYVRHNFAMTADGGLCAQASSLWTRAPQRAAAAAVHRRSPARRYGTRRLPQQAVARRPQQQQLRATPLVWPRAGRPRRRRRRGPPRSHVAARRALPAALLALPAPHRVARTAARPRGSVVARPRVLLQLQLLLRLFQRHPRARCGARWTR
jgi:hypothetical protein